MKSGLRIAIPAAALFLLAGGAPAKDAPPAAPAGKPPATAAPMGGMSMMDMMGRSNMNCMATSDTLESLEKVIKEALKSDDKAKMKSALQKAETHFAGMREHMSDCMGMMKMMGGMMGGMEGKGGGMREGMGPGRDDGKPGPGAHERHHPD